jgi:hypothetical protein
MPCAAGAGVAAGSLCGASPEAGEWAGLAAG